MKTREKPSGSGMGKALGTLAVIAVILIGKGVVKIATKSPMDRVVARGFTGGDNVAGGITRAAPRQDEGQRQVVNATRFVTRARPRQADDGQLENGLDEYQEQPMETSLMSIQGHQRAR